MASSTEENTVPESGNGPQVRTGSPAQTPMSAFEHFQEYGRERPEVVALWCLGLGFILGWKLKPW